MADPDEALTGRESSAASAVASPALIEAIAEALCGLPEGRCDTAYVHRNKAHAAYAAMVEHLGLVEETTTTGPMLIRRLVSRWTEVDHG